MSVFDSLGSTYFLNDDLDKYIEEIWIICIDYTKLEELPKMIEDEIKVLSVVLSDKPKPKKLNLARKILSAVFNFFN